jgi:uncharacterized phage protein (TIGR02220 family)
MHDSQPVDIASTPQIDDQGIHTGSKQGEYPCPVQGEYTGSRHSEITSESTPKITAEITKEKAIADALQDSPSSKLNGHTVEKPGTGGEETPNARGTSAGGKSPARRRAAPDGELALGVKKDRRTKLSGEQIEAANHLIDYLNEKSNANYSKVHEYQVDIVRCLKKTGVMIEECKVMIDREVARCLGQPTEDTQLTPSGLFGYRNFQMKYDRRHQPVNRNFKSAKDIQRERQAAIHDQIDPELGW